MHQVKPEAFTWFTFKIMEVVRRDAIVSLVIGIQYVSLTNEIWETLLYRLPQL